MMDFFFYILAVWGLTHILVASKLMEPTRNWLLINAPLFGDMLNCYQCTSFWTSMILYFMFNDLSVGGLYFYLNEIKIGFDFLLISFIGSGIVSFISIIMSILINKSKG